MPAKKRVRAARTKPADAALDETVLAGVEGPIARVPHRKLESLAMKWTYYVRNRHRWADSPAEARRLARNAVDDLRKLNVSEAELAALSRSPILEAQIGYRTEKQSWAGRIFPWEFVLSSVTRLLGPPKNASLVVRHMRRDAEAREGTSTASSKLLFVSSAPGPFAGRYDFEDEHELLRYPFEQSGKQSCKRVDDPTPSQLAELSARFDAVHLSGIDATLGTEILARSSDRRRSSTAGSDGFYLASDRGEPVFVEAVDFAELLTRSKTPPRLVTFNAYSSAARLASLAVAGGAGAAIGFQDRFEDAQSEQFFAVFYRRWAIGLPLLECFRAGFQALRDDAHVGLGSGIVLWSGASVIAGAEIQPAAPRAPRRQVKYAEKKLREDLRVRVELPPTLNYSKLHNGENLFKRLRIYNHGESVVKDVRLDIVLQAGSELYTYNHRLDLKHPSTALEHKVRVALSWALMRTLTESVQTTILVRAAQDGTVFHEDTYPIELLPANEWVDDENSGPWLPSLVLPRDPIIVKIIDCARRYLRVLADDAHVGFDGYQQVAIDAEEQQVDDDQCFIVDVQVRAIWYALIHDYRLGYINPPPTFTADSQRLRRPSEVIGERHGTCIDLALLFAACLEYIGINPVLFLIDGHAFPGYWRIDRTLKNIAASVSDSMARDDLSQMVAHPRSWSSGRQYWKELKLRVERGQIVPIETVDLTASESFDVAVQHGCRNLDSQAEFNTMLDVMKAREKRVTPLPL